MTQRDNILQELNELNSRLSGQEAVNVYTVPAGYFEGLAEQVMGRIRALGAGNAADELAQLSPALSTLSKLMPQTIPAGYFDELPAKMLQLISEPEASRQTAREETASISPLLGGLKKEMPYHVPQGYFEKLSAGNAAKENKPVARVISISSRRWFRYAAAAVVTGIIVMAGFLIFGKGNEIKQSGKVFAKVTKDVKKLSDTQKDDLIDFLNAGMSGTETAQVNTDTRSKEIKQLLQDVSEAELKDFQEQTEDLEDVLLTN